MPNAPTAPTAARAEKKRKAAVAAVAVAQEDGDEPRESRTRLDSHEVRRALPRHDAARRCSACTSAQPDAVCSLLSAFACERDKNRLPHACDVGAQESSGSRRNEPSQR